ncbi:hypothetical protein [Bacillus sp. MUM 13]|uniref:AbiTii domain-containing protein n=1 Tax=Bacillus sp. MUM 13 TaxID=1678001 RepID=UPI0008F5E4E6|nr:hypothetical protein [Bacillus sp. MUM 13]OIK10069.1 hypothetical protein BIV59_15145 [Bacillus sp. MUM 13]
MESIVLELQREAMNSTTNISDLLRKSLIVARKLKIGEFEAWISQEMNGYKVNRNEVPDYREVVGVIQWFNPYRGWSPVIIQDEKILEILQKNEIIQPVSEIENLVKSDSNDLAILLPQGVQNMLSDYFGEPAQFHLSFGKSQAQQIIETVRNIILEWALKLEEDGIMGEGLSFSDNEKKEASKHNYNITNFYAPTSGVQFQQNTLNSTQTMTNSMDIGQLTDLISKIKENINQAGLTEPQQNVVETEVETIQAELVTAQPRPSVVKNSLQSIRTMLEGAGVNLATSGLMFMIDKISF